MSSNVGLSTPRGSGTSGYVQKNKSLLRSRDRGAPYPQDWDQTAQRHRKPDPEILEHERKRAVEVKIMELRDMLEEKGVDEDEIDDQCEALRRKLEDARKAGKDEGPKARDLKAHQVHDLAKAKIEESERLRIALGISVDYEEGSHWRKQEERMRDSLMQKEAEDEDQLEKAKSARRRGHDSEY